MVIQRISLITLGAYDLPALRAFYKKLGWEETESSSDSYAAFKTAGVILSLFPIAELAKDAGIELTEATQSTNFFRGVTFAINVDLPEEVEATIEEIKKAGGNILREPSEAFWGGKTAYFSDPENNVWEVAWNPESVFDDNGAMLSY